MLGFSSRNSFFPSVRNKLLPATSSLIDTPLGRYAMAQGLISNDQLAKFNLRRKFDNLHLLMTAEGVQALKGGAINPDRALVMNWHELNNILRLHDYTKNIGKAIQDLLAQPRVQYALQRKFLTKNDLAIFIIEGKKGNLDILLSGAGLTALRRNYLTVELALSMDAEYLNSTISINVPAGEGEKENQFIRFLYSDHAKCAMENLGLTEKMFFIFSDHPENLEFLFATNIGMLALYEKVISLNFASAVEYDDVCKLANAYKSNLINRGEYKNKVAGMYCYFGLHYTPSMHSDPRLKRTKSTPESRRENKPLVIAEYSIKQSF